MKADLERADLDRHRRVQRLAYRCAEEVAAGLEPGVTERETTRRMRRWLLANGVDDWFHVPFAWFGDRTAFRGFRLPHQFLPTARPLAEGMPYVLDVAPIVDGYVADIGYSGCLGPNPVWERLYADLAEYRGFILDLVRRRRRFAEIYDEVDALATRQGYDNRHQVYPGRVIGHQVGRLTSRLPRVVVARSFGLRTLETIGRELVKERFEGRSPLWNNARSSDHPPTPGLWAVEPHIGFRTRTPGAVGAKFEELLVVTEDDAHWLDDDLPHVRRWAAGEVTSRA
ncbi:M24 family metallopeptidase [Bailinhaonella thermotolerans]|uniref:Aminopeptidase P family protein n=1 Tax=Bailinhaonella thermotolerans TaxID=1070861 RepID=A0A3A4APJ9_9ACTN|nr:M24 family metallopeptidase [Bailinhaonella thermotolerans]RJL30365.1 aminopeptidase P family protein [Bailinhaonella thermotolerans]